MFDVLTPMVYQLGIGGGLGFFVGFVIKKVLKLVLFVIVFAFAISYFAYDNMIEVRYEQLLSRVQEFVTPAWSFLSPLLANIPFSGSLIVGVIIGFVMS